MIDLVQINVHIEYLGKIFTIQYRKTTIIIAENIQQFYFFIFLLVG